MNPIWQSVFSFLQGRRRHCPGCGRQLPKPSGEDARTAVCPYCGARLDENPEE